MIPLAFDLYCGLGGWAEGFLSEGYRVVGFDIEAHDYGTGGYPGELVLRDVRSIHGAELVSEYGIPAVMVGSSPCQEFSYRAMPWKRAKALPPPHLGIELFEQQFRIQREVSEAAGRYVPLIVENVRGAQKWVGRARWHFGSYFLWGDVPALMPMTFKGFKSSGLNWSDQTKRGQDFTRIAGQQAGGVKLLGNNSPRRWGGDWFGRECQTSMSRMYSSKSKHRKAASALIAKIPFPLAQHIARCFKPVCEVQEIA
jgi:hypothetical protein